MDIFKKRHFHPGIDKLIKEHYKDFYDSVFVALFPFFKLKVNPQVNPNFQKVHEITFEESKKDIEAFRNMPPPAAKIYSYENKNYPDDKEIFENAIPVSWEEVKQGCGFVDFKELNKALRTSIGAYKNVFSRTDLAKRLLDFISANQIFIPTEGHFEVLTKVQMLKAFRLLGKKIIIVEDEYQNKKEELYIDDISNEKFVDAITFKDYYIYDIDKQLLFTVDWDDFYFFICSDKNSLNIIQTELKFEGFYADNSMYGGWEYSRKELDEGLIKEKQSKQNESTKKPWWKVW